MNLFAWSCLITAIFTALLGLFTLLKNPKNKINRSWFLVCLSVFLWTIGLFGTVIVNNKEGALFWQRMLYIGTILIPLFFFYFCTIFLKRENKEKIIFFVGFVLAVLFIFLVFSKLFIIGVENRTDFGYWPVKTGPLYGLFLIYFLFYVFYSILLLKIDLKKYDGIYRRQIQYIYYAALIGFAGGATNFLLDFNLNIYPLGNYFVIFYVIFVAYAIFKYHLFNIRVIATELLVFMIWIFTLIRLMLSGSFQERVINVAFLALLIIFGILLIRSVLKEVRQREEIQKLSEFKTELLSIVAHQIKNPLVTIKGYASLVEDKTISGAEAILDVFKKIKAVTDKLVMLLNNLLDFHRLEEGKMHYEFRKIELNKLLKDIIDGFRIVAQQRNLNLVFEPLPSEVYVNGDIHKLSQVFQNLIDNAIKYTEKGWIKINVKCQMSSPEASPPLAENIKDKEEVIITVSDSGRGMSQDLTQKLFQKFSRGVEETKAYGSGLGLYISKEIIEAHQGEIWAESEGEGKGSKFFVKLPKIS